MKQGAWRTGPPHKYPSPVVKPSGWQIIRQGLILLLIVAVWGGVLAVFANAIASSELVVASAAAPTPMPTAVPVPSPTSSALPATATATLATPTPSATRTPVAATATTIVTSSPTATRTPLAATATTVATSSPTVLPTDPPLPPEPSATPQPVGSAQVSFARDVQPIFDRVCVKCHGGDEVKEGLVLKTYAEIMTGSDNGPVIAPGDPANSLLIDLITQGKMPKNGPRLLPGEIRAITDWVAAGAANN